MTLQKQPGSMVVVGSGAIGSEFASFYRAIGTDVTLIEFLPRIVPNEDEEVSKQLERSFKKLKMRVMTDSSVESADITGEKCRVSVKTPKGTEIIETDIVLSAVGITPNLENIGLESTGIKTEKGKIAVDDFYRTSVPGIFAIGDIVHGPALAHVASAEGIICVEKIAGAETAPLDYKNIPSLYLYKSGNSILRVDRGCSERGRIRNKSRQIPLYSFRKSKRCRCKGGIHQADL